jgi:hypothetical protein
MERRVLVLPKSEPFGFVRIADVRVNSRVTGIQMYFPVGRVDVDLDYRIRRDGLRRFDGVEGEWERR